VVEDGGVIGLVFAGEGNGVRGDVDTMDVDRDVSGGGVGKKRVQEEEGDAACPCAKVEDGEGVGWRLGVGENGSQVKGVSLCLRSDDAS